MRTLPDIQYIHKYVHTNSDHPASHQYIDKKDIKYFSEDHAPIMSYYEFINVNHIIDICEDTYRFYLDTIYEYDWHSMESPYYGMYHMIDIFNLWHHESRWNSRDLVEILKADYDTIKEVIYDNPKKRITSFTIIFENDVTDIINKNYFWEDIRLYDYYVYKIDQNAISIKPYHPKDKNKCEDITKYIYEDCKGIIYWPTTKSIYEKVKDSELCMSWNSLWDKLQIKPYDIWKETHVYFITDKDKIQLKDNEIIVKIDLYKYRKDILFRLESTAFGYDAYYANNPIPGYCMEEII